MGEKERGHIGISECENIMMGHGKPHRCVRNRRTGLKTMVRERKLSCD